MKANPDKFQTIAIGKRTLDRNPVFNIDDIDIIPENSVKLLGVEIISLLNFNKHISLICKRASSQINAFKRIGNNLTLKSRKTMFHAFIMSNFNLCPIIWHFCGKQNSDKLELLQYRALNYVYSDHISSYKVLLTKCQMSTLHLQRLRYIAIETCKILYGKSPSYSK